MPPRPSFNPKPWWTRFGRPIVSFPGPRRSKQAEEEYVDQSWYPRERTAEDEEEEMRFMQTTTYPPDYPKWDSDQVIDNMNRIVRWHDNIELNILKLETGN